MFIRNILLVAGLLTGLPVLAQIGGAIKAGLITETRGNVAAQSGQGKPTTLKKGQPVQPGMVIESAPDSDTVLAFPDGQIGVLGSKGNVRLNNYVYDLTDPSKNDINLNLIEGNLRVVMGEIGKTNPTALKLQVGTASVALRPSSDASPADASLVSLSGAIAVSVQAGQLAVRLPDGSLIQVAAGQTLVLSQDGKPQLDTTAKMMQTLGESTLGKQIQSQLMESQNFTKDVAAAQVQMAAVNAALKDPVVASKLAAPDKQILAMLEDLPPTGDVAAPQQPENTTTSTPATGAGAGGGGGGSFRPASPN
jgi:hypothetical protein